jgi:Ca2+/Na+ antiporter
MSSADRLLLILHIGFAIFSLGPLTAATMATPRYIRKGDTRVLRYLNRVSRIYGLLTLGIFLFGILLAHGKFSQVWLTVSMTLFIVAFVLLLIVERDQRKALHKLELAEAKVAAPVATPTEPAEPAETVEGEAAETEAEAVGPAPAPVTGDLAKVETGRIATISGVVALIWIVILVLMVWNG